MEPFLSVIWRIKYLPDAIQCCVGFIPSDIGVLHDAFNIEDFYFEEIYFGLDIELGWKLDFKL